MINVKSYIIEMEGYCMSMQEYISELNSRRTKIEAGGSETAQLKVKQAGKMTARERITTLFDEGSFVEIGAFIKPRNTDFNLVDLDLAADGVVTGYGTIGGRLAYVYSQDTTVLGGSLGEMHAKKIVDTYDLAMKVGAPIIGLLDSIGMRLQESTDALNGYGQIFVKQSLASGVIPQITAILGTCGGSASMLPSLSDFVLMKKEDTALFLNSANTLDETRNATEVVGSSTFHAANAGIIDVVSEDEAELVMCIKTFIGLLPSNNHDGAPVDGVSDDMNRVIPEFNLDIEGGLDGIAAVKAVFDKDSCLVLKEAYAMEVVTAIGKLGGMTVGIIANQGDLCEGRLSLNGCKKISEFVTTLDAFSIPVITLVDVAGYSATLGEESAGQSKEVAKMISSFASATVPKISVLTNRAIGSAYVALNSKHIGADFVYAWPSAKVSVMDPDAAVRIMYADEIEASAVADELIGEKISEYRLNQASPYIAASHGYIDDIIEPAATRKRLIAALDMLYTKYVTAPDRKHRSV